MPIQAYERQVSPVKVTLQAPRAPVSVASALGQTLGALGQAAGSVAKVQYQVKEAESEADFQIAQIEKQRRQAAFRAGTAGRLAQIDVDLDKSAETIPEYSAPGAAGYAAARSKQIDAAYDGLLDEATDPEDRQWLEPIIAERKARQKMAAQGYEDNTARAYSADQLNQYDDAAANSLMRDPSGDNLDRLLTERGTIMAGMHLDGRTGPAMEMLGKRRLVGATLDGLMQKGDHKAVTALLDSGKLDGVLSDEQVKGYRQLTANMAEAEARKAEMAQAEAQKGALEGLETIKVRIEHGEDVPVSEIQGALAAAKAAGVPDAKLLNYAYLAEDAIEMKGTRAGSTPVLEQRAEQLRAKRNAGQASDAEVRELDRIEKELKGRGGNQAAQLGPMLKGTPEQRVEALGTLAGMSVPERFRVAGATGNVKPALLAGIPAEARGWAVQGQIKRKDRDEVYLPPQSATIKTKDDQKRKLDRDMMDFLGPEIYASVGPMRGAIQDGALDIMAGRNDGYVQGDFNMGLRIMFGGTARSDGSWQGGVGKVNGRKMVLPSRWNESEVEGFVNNWPFTGAIYGNGSPAQLADVRRNYHLEFSQEDDDGAYYLVKDAKGRPLMFRDGKGQVMPYVLRIDPRPKSRGGR